MGRIDSISRALNTEQGVDLSTGKFVMVNDHSMGENQILPAEVIEEISTFDGNELSPVNQVGPLPEKTNEHIKDEEDVKRNLRELIQKSMDLADDMFEIVRVSESPKSFEPASAFLKTLVDLNEKLLDIHDRDRKMIGKSINSRNKDEKTSSGTTNVQNNTVICADPTEILKSIKKGNKQ